MEPVDFIGTVGCNRSGLSVFFVDRIGSVKFPDNLAAFTVDLHNIIFYGGKIRTVSGNQQIAVRQFLEIVVHTTRDHVLVINLTAQIDFLKACFVVHTLQKKRSRHHQMTILQLMNAKYPSICEVPADVTGTVQCVEHTCRRADKCQIGIIIGRIITHGCLDRADIDLSLFGANFYGCGSAILQCQDYFCRIAIVQSVDRDKMIRRSFESSGNVIFFIFSFDGDRAAKLFVRMEGSDSSQRRIAVRIDDHIWFFKRISGGCLLLQGFINAVLLLKQIRFFKRSKGSGRCRFIFRNCFGSCFRRNAFCFTVVCCFRSRTGGRTAGEQRNSQSTDAKTG